MTNDLDETLAKWADKHPEILSLFVFGSRARDDARPDSDLDLAFELDESREHRLQFWWSIERNGSKNCRH